MLRSARLDRIKELIEVGKYVSLSELADVLSCSKSTIRRDLEYLSSENEITMIRGGAISSQKRLLSEPTYNEKILSSKEEKRRIAQAAAELLTPGQTIFVDSGTTCRELISFIVSIPSLHVITNDIANAADLTNAVSEVTVLGGTLRRGYFSLGGYYTERMMSEFSADIAFIGMDALDIKHGCMISNVDEIGIKRAVLTKCNTSVVLCDHNKFNAKACISICPLAAVDYFITGSELDPAIRTAFETNCKDIAFV